MIRALLLSLLLAGVARGDDLVPLAAEQVKQRWHSRLDGRHFSARIVLYMDLGGLREKRLLRVWRDDARGSDERLLVRFEAPADLRDVGILYLEHPDLPNDYFLYQPSTRRVRRLPASVADDDIFGIDLEFLGFGVAQTEPTEIESVESVRVQNRAAYQLRERALHMNPHFDERTTWIDAESFVALRTEHRRGGEIVLSAESIALQDIDGVPTPMRMSFRSTRGGSERSVELVVESVDYASPIPEEYFSAMALVRKGAVD